MRIFKENGDARRAHPIIFLQILQQNGKKYAH